MIADPKNNLAFAYGMIGMNTGESYCHDKHTACFFIIDTQNVSPHTTSTHAYTCAHTSSYTALMPCFVHKFSFHDHLHAIISFFLMASITELIFCL